MFRLRRSGTKPTFDSLIFKPLPIDQRQEVMSDSPSIAAQRNFQNAFVRIAVDRSLREAFLADPEDSLAPFELPERALRALADIPHDAFSRYAESLLTKRAREFRSAIPLSLSVAPSLVDRYRRWLAEHPAPKQMDVLPPGLREALRAAGPLARELREDPGEAAYAADVMALEVISAASRIDREQRILKARFRADLLLRSIRRGRLPVDPAPYECEFRVLGQTVDVRPTPSFEHEVEP